MALALPTEFDFDPSLHLSLSAARRGVLESRPLLELVFDWLDVDSLLATACVCQRWSVVASAEEIWKWRCLLRWPELEHSTGIALDPFPAFKKCFERKTKDEASATSMDDLMSIFGECDWYSCPNGHLYVIGECRIPVEVAKCPECGAQIGGRYHRMLDTNERVGGVSQVTAPWRVPESRTAVAEAHFGDIGFGDVAAVVTGARDALTRPGTDPRVDIAGGGQQGGQILETITVREVEMDVAHLFEELRQGGVFEPPAYLVCPISHELFTEPVSTPSGNLYERHVIERWLEDNDCDPQDSDGPPITGQQLQPDDDTRRAAAEFRRLLAEERIRGFGGHRTEELEETEHKEHETDEKGDAITGGFGLF